jgi:hypothetical protein
MDPIQTFVNRATDLLRNLSYKPDVLQRPLNNPELPDWILTSLEVTIDRASAIGRGALGCIYKGEWGGQVCFSLLSLWH